MEPVYTIGHSTLPLTEFLDILGSNGVKRLADIRTVPRSRRNPQYNQETLPAALAQAGIEYIHLSALGGLRPTRKDMPEGSPNLGWDNESFRNYADYALTQPFREGLDELIDLASVPVGIMCAESVWWRCHRRIVADYLLTRGVKVLDIVPPSPPEPHQLTSFARVQPDGNIFYVAAQQKLAGF